MLETLKNPARARSNLERNRVSIIEKGNSPRIDKFYRSGHPTSSRSRSRQKQPNPNQRNQKHVEILRKQRPNKRKSRNPSKPKLSASPNAKPFKKSVFKDRCTMSQTHNGFFRPAKTPNLSRPKTRKSLHQNKNYRKNVDILRKSRSYVGQFLDPSHPDKKFWGKDKANQTAAEISRLVFGDESVNQKPTENGQDLEWSAHCKNLRANTENFSPNNHFQNLGNAGRYAPAQKLRGRFAAGKKSFVSVYSGGFAKRKPRKSGQNGAQRAYDVFDKLSRSRKRDSNPKPDVQQRERDKEMKELRECTFKPQINDLSRMIHDIQNGRIGSCKSRTTKGNFNTSLFIFLRLIICMK